MPPPFPDIPGFSTHHFQKVLLFPIRRTENECRRNGRMGVSTKLSLYFVMPWHDFSFLSAEPDKDDALIHTSEHEYLIITLSAEYRPAVGMCPFFFQTSYPLYVSRSSVLRRSFPVRTAYMVRRTGWRLWKETRYEVKMKAQQYGLRIKELADTSKGRCRRIFVVRRITDSKNRRAVTIRISADNRNAKRPRSIRG